MCTRPQAVNSDHNFMVCFKVFVSVCFNVFGCIMWVYVQPLNVREVEVAG